MVAGCDPSYSVIRGCCNMIFNVLYCFSRPGFQLELENLEKWEGIFQSGKIQGILNRLEKSGKITQNTGKFREFQTNVLFVIF